MSIILEGKSAIEHTLMPQIKFRTPEDILKENIEELKVRFKNMSRQMTIMCFPFRRPLMMKKLVMD